MKNITGQRFGKLTALRPTEKQGRNMKWMFRCDCGREKEFQARNVGESKGQSASCGCEKREDLTGRKFNMLSVLRESPDARGMGRGMVYECECECGQNLRVPAKYLKSQKSCGCANGGRHGDSDSVEYKAWEQMIRRCHNQSADNFSNYGGRGIVVCDDWRKSYLMFLGHVGRRLSAEHSIGRIENAGNYEPGNVRWETREQQNNNARSNVFLEHDGKRMTCAQWDRECGLPSGMISGRVNRGWSAERAITTPDSNGKWTKSVNPE